MKKPDLFVQFIAPLINDLVGPEAQAAALEETYRPREHNGQGLHLRILPADTSA